VELIAYTVKIPAILFFGMTWMPVEGCEKAPSVNNSLVKSSVHYKRHSLRNLGSPKGLNTQGDGVTTVGFKTEVWQQKQYLMRELFQWLPVFSFRLNTIAAPARLKRCCAKNGLIRGLFKLKHGTQILEPPSKCQTVSSKTKLF
jgi:hypothetical protein